jgi:hypothetical protein
VGTLEMEGGRKALIDRDKANILLGYFKSVYRIPRLTDDRTLDGILGSIPIIPEFTVSVDQVFDEFKAAGPDGIHPAIVRWPIS